MFQSISRSKTTDLVAAEIQELILTNQLADGEKLPSERDLARRFNVSRNVLREGLSALRQRGLVEVIPGKGTVVSAPSLGSTQDNLTLLLLRNHVSLLELCDARLLIEPELAWRAASAPTDANTDKLESLGAQLLGKHDDVEQHVKADLDFHQEIANLANHGVFSAFVGAVREPVMRSMALGTSVPGAIERGDEQHIAVLRAILERNPERAREAMREHIEYVTDYIHERASGTGELAEK